MLSTREGEEEWTNDWWVLMIACPAARMLACLYVCQRLRKRMAGKDQQKSSVRAILKVVAGSLLWFLLLLFWANVERTRNEERETFNQPTKSGFSPVPLFNRRIHQWLASSSSSSSVDVVCFLFVFVFFALADLVSALLLCQQHPALTLLLNVLLLFLLLPGHRAPILPPPDLLAGEKRGGE